MKKHWLATPKPFIAWGIFMGLMTGGAFAPGWTDSVPRGRGGEREQPAFLSQSCSQRPS